MRRFEWLRVGADGAEARIPDADKASYLVSRADCGFPPLPPSLVLSGHAASLTPY
jgi:hypothetical protein